MHPAKELQNPGLRLVPAGKVTFGAGNVTLNLSGDWQASWQVPGK